MSDQVCNKLQALLDELPDSHTLLHADFHLKNIMVVGEDLMLIDMDTLSAGDPIFEMATIYNSYMEFPSIAPEAALFLGIDVPTANRIWYRTLEYFTGDKGPDYATDITRRSRIFGCIRIIDYMSRHDDHKAREECLSACIRDITALI